MTMALVAATMLVITATVVHSVTSKAIEALLQPASAV
jgi:hypothetical protein